MKHGVDDCLDKPIDMNELGEVVSNMLAAQSGNHHYLAAKLDGFLRADFGESGHLFRFQSGHPSERSDAGCGMMG